MNNNNNMEKVKKLLNLYDGLNDDKYESRSSEEQKEVENRCINVYGQWILKVSNFKVRPILWREKHIKYLISGLRKLGSGFTGLDASRPWIIYWIVHSLDLLNHNLDEELVNDIIQFLRKCQHSKGGFGGGPGQEAHLAPTYAAVATLLTLGTKEAYELIDRKNLYKYLLRIKTHYGGFMVHDGGEIDTRGAYTALSVASMCNILTAELSKNTGDWLKSCQTYEGGIGGEPGNEAHGGYTFCGLAAMMILGEEKKLDIEQLLYWASHRQLGLEGGFQGRTNKLVDGCYTYWVGGLFPLIQMIINSKQKNNEKLHTTSLLNEEALQRYVLLCCQRLNGGLIDKPGKHADFYHTCYNLSGLSLIQQYNIDKTYDWKIESVPTNDTVEENKIPYMNHANILKPNNALYNISSEKVQQAFKYFMELPSINQL